MLADELMDGLVQTSFAVMAILNRVGAEHDLSTTQVRLLGILRDREPRMAGLADFLGLDRSSISGLIDRAETRGLVRRDASPDDGRGVRVSLTTDGRALAQAVEGRVRAQVADLAGVLSAGEQQRLGALVTRLVNRA
jgi:MarR family transcriptional regulator, lower aerobic nicotinate degradation pathway regulator